MSEASPGQGRCGSSLLLAYDPRMPTPPEAQVLTLPTTSGEVTGSGPGEYLGYTIRETSGSAVAKVILYDNASAASGEIVEEIAIASGAVAETQFNRPGRQVVFGLYASITGAIQGSVFQ